MKGCPRLETEGRTVTDGQQSALLAGPGDVRTVQYNAQDHPNATPNGLLGNCADSLPKFQAYDYGRRIRLSPFESE